MTDGDETIYPLYPLWNTYHYDKWRDSIIYGTHKGEVSRKDIFVQNEQMLKHLNYLSNLSNLSDIRDDIRALKTELGHIRAAANTTNASLLGILLMLGYNLWRLYFA
jgi:hypothetical protein